MITGFDVAWSTLVKSSGRSQMARERALRLRPSSPPPSKTPRDYARGHGGGTKDWMEADRRKLVPDSLKEGGHLTGPAMSDRDWDFHEGYEGADQRGKAGPEAPDYDWEMAERGDGRFDWPREQGQMQQHPDEPYEDEDEEQVYGRYLAEQRQKERQQIMDRGVPDPREATEEEIPQGYEMGNQNRLMRKPPPEVPMNPFKKAWDSLSR